MTDTFTPTQGNSERGMNNHEVQSAVPEGWSILDGYFDSEMLFPDPQKIKEFEKILGDPTQDSPERLHLQERIYYSSLLLYALESCNSQIFTDKDRIRSIGEEIRQAMDHCLELRRAGRQDELQRVTEGTIYPREVPIMQALKELQEYQVIDYEERTLLDAATREIEEKQSLKRSRFSS